ncbi:Glyoxalase/Bleomycin resistance protein/Dioxygenase superfamily protein [Rathayibacter oskolensis]|uniref:Glyoxalase/Bleomycin resistance protein/Dioxygenase superfamily protein n=1 Tax=Rathayibacter oskolensis TaxID=1891671 RepID=A0A1X7NQ97_9MICO|nr:VOC family protein [Rathayibacter oskolensis]SMH39658.1 Glyoxalase/Bleomycin resistance protein/Dioxygenase superfamily protein [Rathayibacter oskolensis]
MLSDHPLGPVLLTTDLAASRAFYAGTLGLEILEESESAIAYASGGTRLTVTTSTVGSKDEQTKAAWRVEDLRAELAELAARGVIPEDYDTDELRTENGIADRGSVWAAWRWWPESERAAPR